MSNISHPKSENVRKVIALLTSVLPMAVREDHLDMSQASINTTKDHKCGTTNCHGGWYVIANKLHYREKKRFFLGDKIVCTRGLGFNDGIRLMSEHLGFGLGENILTWAGCNPDVWGNNYGTAMFSGEIAFIHKNKRPSGAKTLQHIIDHWTEVAIRLERMEQGVEISDPPVTAEHLVTFLEQAPAFQTF